MQVHGQEGEVTRCPVLMLPMKRDAGAYGTSCGDGLRGPTPRGAR